ncbi:hypothetical protein [Microbacterium sp. C7(2022)]|uniref:hypothetical protein n=1 Tax=Microbacterium sp. C7(2022) TaxID=2992759 RepID=UPI00237AA813|nr:hypothetical protein [Microbacterium sp. C7(2022)]MDE0546041.1 hypothetical protein [Microbacterium sp. C7(2022)]
MRVSIHKVPIDVRRRAARAISALESNHVMPSKRQRTLSLALSEEATPIYRPDLKDPAYWELEITGVKTVVHTGKDDTEAFDRGFIIVATGPHDVPIPHLSLDTAGPSRQLEHQAPDAARVLKLDALCYAAEHRDGSLLAHIGTMPPKLEALADDMIAKPPAGWAISAESGNETDKGEKLPPLKMRRSRETRPYKEVGTWRSWAELTRGYEASYASHLAALAKRAEEPWQIEKLTDEFGCGIHSGEAHSILLLDKGEFALSGPGAEYVSAELDESASPPTLVLKAKTDASVKDTSFEVALRYDGASETLPYFIVPVDATTTVRPQPSLLGPIFGGASR